MSVREQIKEDLLEQLHMKGMDSAFYVDLVNDYMNYYDIKNGLQEVIDEQGYRVDYMTGNGFKKSEINKAIKEKRDTSSFMLRILAALDLKTPVQDEPTEDDYL